MPPHHPGSSWATSSADGRCFHLVSRHRGGGRAWIFVSVRTPTNPKKSRDVSKPRCLLCAGDMRWSAHSACQASPGTSLSCFLTSAPSRLSVSPFPSKEECLLGTSEHGVCTWQNSASHLCLVTSFTRRGRASSSLQPHPPHDRACGGRRREKPDVPGQAEPRGLCKPCLPPSAWPRTALVSWLSVNCLKDKLQE